LALDAVTWKWEVPSYSFRSAERSTILIERLSGFQNPMNPVLSPNNVACSAAWVDGAAK
jgi:hypothetical protein